MIGWLLNNVPWYAWAALAVVPVATFWPIIPAPIKKGIIAIGTLGAVYLIGRKGGADYEKQKQRDRDAAAERKRGEIERDVASRSDSDVKRDLGKWVRK